MEQQPFLSDADNSNAGDVGDRGVVRDDIPSNIASPDSVHAVVPHKGSVKMQRFDIESDDAVR